MYLRATPQILAREQEGRGPRKGLGGGHEVGRDGGWRPGEGEDQGWGRQVGASYYPEHQSKCLIAGSVRTGGTLFLSRFYTTDMSHTLLCTAITMQSLSRAPLARQATCPVRRKEALYSSCAYSQTDITLHVVLHFHKHAVIIESTYGVSNHMPREERERQFLTRVHNTVRKGGRVLLPVVALGRSQVSVDISMERQRGRGVGVRTGWWGGAR